MSEPITGPTETEVERAQRLQAAKDARKRAVRTFVQGLAIDAAVAVAALWLAKADEITDTRGIVIFLVAVGKTVLTSAASYVMRRFLDRSAIPTPPR